MSQKWIRSKAWDDRHLTGALLPVKFLARLFSSVYFGVGLLVLVACYGILASVPIGLIALAPTWLVYALSLVVTVVVLAGVPVWFGAKLLPRSVTRFVIGLLAGLALAVGAVMIWRATVWPALRFDPVTGSGFRVFGEFVDANKATQFRRLSMMEMSELEFYSWWPLRVILILFVANMVFATLRRIEFGLPYIGVITVHSGIVTIALGSVYYAAKKQEGDVFLTAGAMGADGAPGERPGVPETGFYDNTRTALWVQQPGKSAEVGWQMRPLRGVPRYHDYNLNVLGVKSLPPIMSSVLGADGGVLSIEAAPAHGGPSAVDDDIAFRVVGYTPFAELVTRMLRVGEIDAAQIGSPTPMSVRTVEAYLRLPAIAGEPETGDPSRPRKVWKLMPESPARRVDVLSVEGQALLGVEYTRGMSDRRWRDLGVPLPRGAQHALIVRHPASGLEEVYPVRRGSRITVGDTGYSLTVEQIAAEPPFPIVTRGYQGATSSVAVVRVKPPGDGKEFERWVYHRFPEINQDLTDGGMSRGGPNPAIEIALVDASIIQIYFDESTVEGKPVVRALVRVPGGSATITPSVAAGGEVTVSEGFSLKLAEGYDDAVRVEFPVAMPESQRDPKMIGNHQKASVAVEVTATVGGKPWKTVQWTPFGQYLDVTGGQNTRMVNLPDGRSVRIAFGRVRHEFWPPMAIGLVDFKMTPYPHSQTPRDYSSELLVSSRWGGEVRQERRRTSLNEPLLVRTPFQRRDGLPPVVSQVVNAIGWAFDKIAPNQYKFSQAGWDQEGWTQSQAATDRGELKRPFARYTILGVGNNPGIYIIAAGAVMMCVGIPWAFYIKPLMMQRRKRKIQRQLAEGTYVRPGRARENGKAVEQERPTMGVEA